MYTIHSFCYLEQRPCVHAYHLQQHSIKKRKCNMYASVLVPDIYLIRAMFTIVLKTRLKALSSSYVVILFDNW